MCIYMRVLLFQAPCHRVCRPLARSYVYIYTHHRHPRQNVYHQGPPALSTPARAQASLSSLYPRAVIAPAPRLNYALQLRNFSKACACSLSLSLSLSLAHPPIPYIYSLSVCLPVFLCMCMCIGMYREREREEAT